MEKNREGYLVSDTHRECTGCGEFFEKTSGMTLCKKCNSNRVKSYRPETRMYNRAKQRARKNGREFTIAVEDIVIPDTCPVLGYEINVNSGKPGAYHNSPSLDRIDNSRGCTPDNIQVISQRANAMKAAATNVDLHNFARWVLSSVPGGD